MNAPAEPVDLSDDERAANAEAQENELLALEVTTSLDVEDLLCLAYYFAKNRLSLTSSSRTIDQKASFEGPYPSHLPSTGQ